MTSFQAPSQSSLGNTQPDVLITLPQPPWPLPKPWKLETPLRYPVPTTAGSSGVQTCYNYIKEYDENMCKAWRDEIDKLLIFAGLFSATVTAFTVESYQWLDTSNDTNSQLLAQLVAMQLNTTIPVVSTGPTPSVIRINICWFLSLALALITVLFGILCLQWVREYQQPQVMTFDNKLRHRQLRFEGLIAWKVPQVIGFLPLLLQLALILFFVGIVDLLWEKNRLVGVVVLIPIACATFILLATTLLPVLQIGWLCQFGPYGLTQCPYKSPLSWLVYQLFLPLLRLCFSKIPDSGMGWDQVDEYWFQFVSVNAGMLPNALNWMKMEFRYDQTFVIPIYQCLQEMDEVLFLRLSPQMREELGRRSNEFSATEHFPLEQLQEIACALQIATSRTLECQMTFVEYCVRLSNWDWRFLTLILLEILL